MFVIGFLFAQGFAVFFDHFLDGSPGVGLFIITFVPLVLFPLAGFWLLAIVSALRTRLWRLGLSKMLGLPFGILLAIGMARAGAPPWRLQFEIMRPYYFARVWMAPSASDGHKVVTFTPLDKELWTGHEKRQIVYDSDAYRRAALLSENIPRCSSGDTTQLTNLGLGFFAKHVMTEYGGCSTH